MSRDFEELRESFGVSAGITEIDDLLDAMEDAGYYDEDNEDD